MRSVGNVFATYIIVAMVLIASIEVALMIHGLVESARREVWSEASRLNTISNKPGLSIRLVDGDLYLCITPLKDIMVKYIVLEYGNGSVRFIEVGRAITNYTEIPVIRGYDGSPVRIGIITSDGAVIYYNPAEDPRVINSMKYSPVIINSTYVDSRVVQAITLSDHGSINYDPSVNSSSIYITLPGTISVGGLVTDNNISIVMDFYGVGPASINVIEPQSSSVSVGYRGGYGVYKYGFGRVASIDLGDLSLDIYVVFATEISDEGYPRNPTVVGIWFNSSLPLLIEGEARVRLYTRNPFLAGILDRDRTCYALVLAPLSNFTGETLVHRFWISSYMYVAFEGWARGVFVTDGPLILAYAYYSGGANYLGLHVEINITSIRVVEEDLGDVVVGLPRAFYYSLRDLVGFSTRRLDYLTRCVTVLYNMSMQVLYDGIIFRVPVNGSVYAERGIGYRSQYMIVPYGMARVTVRMGLFMPLSTGVSVVYVKNYGRGGWSDYSTTVDLVRVSVKHIIPLIGPHMPRAVYILAGSVSFEIVVQPRPRGIVAELDQFMRNQSVIAHVFSGIPLRIYSPCPINATMYILDATVSNGRLMVAYSIQDSVDAYTLTIKPGRTDMVIDKRPGTYIIVVEPNTLDETTIVYTIVIILYLV